MVRFVDGPAGMRGLRADLREMNGGCADVVKIIWITKTVSDCRCSRDVGIQRSAIVSDIGQGRLPARCSASSQAVLH